MATYSSSEEEDSNWGDNNLKDLTNEREKFNQYINNKVQNIDIKNKNNLLHIDDKEYKNHTLLLETHRTHDIQIKSTEILSHDFKLDNIYFFQIQRVSYLLPPCIKYDVIIEEFPQDSCMININNLSIVTSLIGSKVVGESKDTLEYNNIYHPEIYFEHSKHINFRKLKILLKPQGITQNSYKHLNDIPTEIYPNNYFFKEYHTNFRDSESIDDNFDHSMSIQIKIKTKNQNRI